MHSEKLYRAIALGAQREFKASQVHARADCVRGCLVNTNPALVCCASLYNTRTTAIVVYVIYTFRVKANRWLTVIKCYFGEDV